MQEITNSPVCLTPFQDLPSLPLSLILCIEGAFFQSAMNINGLNKLNAIATRKEENHQQKHPKKKSIEVSIA
jgi:hypothetical protein